MLNCIYQDIVVEKVSQEFSPSGISETFLEMKIIIKHLDPLSDYRATHLVFFYVKVHAVLDVKQISLTWILLIYSNFEILAYTRIIYAKKYWNVFAFLSGVSKWLVIYFDRFYTFFTAVCSILVSSQSIFGKETFYDFSDKINNTKSRRLVAIFHIYKSLNILKILNLPLDVASVLN